MAKGLTAFLAICILAMAFLPGVSAASEDVAADRLLIDHGNGDIAWYDIVPGDTYREVLQLSVPDLNIIYSQSEEDTVVVSVDGMGNTGLCSWRLYLWDEVVWNVQPMDADMPYDSGCFALGFYPEDSIVPAANPDYPTVWTSYRGDSSSSGISDSYGPDTVAKPLEWYNTYAGAVDCSILYADGMIYHTVSGLYGSVGMDSLAWLYCLDPVNKEVAWSVSYSDSGNIEIVTPVIIGDMIVLFSGNWHIYCFDRLTGEPLAEMVPTGTQPDKCNKVRTTEYDTYRTDPTVSYDRVHVSAGPTNAVYDSGALYFGTSDGVMRCYTIDREHGFTKVWETTPDDDVRGCFYFYPPCITYSDGKRVLLHGNYTGNLICADASTGEILWSKGITDSKGNKAGAVTSISVCEGERVLICFSDGGMSASSGGMALISLDGGIIWENDYLGSKPAVYGDRAYVYISYTHNGADTIRDHDTGRDVELVSGYYSLWVDDCSLCWVQDTEAVCGGGITYCDGRVYGMDYSPGSEGSLGGWVWCLDADTGDVVWKAKVTPYAGTAYSMCTPTVVDGKVIVGNDYGAIYIISEIPGVERSTSERIDYDSQGLTHWSWLLIFAVSALIAVTAFVLYRRA